MSAAFSAVRNAVTLRFFNCRHVKRGRKKDQMFGSRLELLVVRGVLSGRRFSVVVGGSRLGRSSICEIAIDDPNRIIELRCFMKLQKVLKFEMGKL